MLRGLSTRCAYRIYRITLRDLLPNKIVGILLVAYIRTGCASRDFVKNKESSFNIQFSLQKASNKKHGIINKITHTCKFDNCH